MLCYAMVCYVTLCERLCNVSCFCMHACTHLIYIYIHTQIDRYTFNYEGVFAHTLHMEDLPTAWSASLTSPSSARAFGCSPRQLACEQGPANLNEKCFSLFFYGLEMMRWDPDSIRDACFCVRLDT